MPTHTADGIVYTVGSSPVAVTAPYPCSSVTVQQSDSPLVPFVVQNPSHAVVANPTGGAQYVFTPPAGTIYSPGQIVGYILIASGSHTFLARPGTQTSLAPFTGDSGSGGLSGVVPAPAAGDAAAGAFLKASGAWAVPSGGGGGSPGGASGTIQYNDGSGGFAGALYSSVDPSSGVVTWDDGGGGTITLNPTSGGYGPNLLINESGIGLAEIAAQGIFLANGAKISQFGNSSTDVNQFSFQTVFSVPDPVVSEYAAVIINATSSLTNPLDGIRVVSTFTDNSAAGTFARGGIFQAEIVGSNVQDDSAYGLAAYVINDGYPGNPAELSGLVVLSMSNFGSSATTQTGVHIQDQGQNAQASGINAGLLIDNQTAGANVYSIYTNAGPVWIGDWIVTYASGGSAASNNYGIQVNTTGTTAFGYQTLGMVSYAAWNGATGGAGSLGATAGYFGAENQTANVSDFTVGGDFYAFGDEGGGSSTDSIGIRVGAGSITGGVTNTGLQIGDMAPGLSATYAIKTGLGPVYFGDTLVVSVDPTSDSYAMQLHGALDVAVQSDPTNTTTVGNSISVQYNGNGDMGGIGGLTINVQNESSYNLGQEVGFQINTGATDGGGTADQGIGVLIQSVNDFTAENDGLVIADIAGAVSNYAIKTGLGDIAFGNSGGNLGFFATAPAPVQTVSGAKVDPVAASILAALVQYGLVIDSTT